MRFSEIHGCGIVHGSRVERLDFGVVELQGEIPPELGNLTKVRGLDLSNKQLTGRIPPELANLDDLDALNLSDNRLTGEIPPELGNLRGLVVLDLSNNQLTGEISPELGNLVCNRLHSLDLSNNQLTGEIPPELRDDGVGCFDHWDFSNNQLSGRLSRESPLLRLARDKWPQYVDTSRQLMGLIGNHLILPPRKVLSSMVWSNTYHEANYLDLQNWGSEAPLGEWKGVTVDDNNLVTELKLTDRDIFKDNFKRMVDRGAVRILLPPQVGFLTDLTVLDLSGNHISGIPLELELLTNLEVLDLSGNNLYSLTWVEYDRETGEEKEYGVDFGTLTSLRVLDLGGNPNLQGGCIADSLQSQLDMGKSDLGGLPSCGERDRLEREKEREAERAQAQLEAQLEAERRVLATLYNATGGGGWWDDANWMSDAPTGSWFGVTTDGGGFVTSLELYENGLTGQVPSELGSLSRLTKLHLFANNLSGCVPASLRTQLTDAELGSLDYCP